MEWKSEMWQSLRDEIIFYKNIDDRNYVLRLFTENIIYYPGWCRRKQISQTEGVIYWEEGEGWRMFMSA